MQCTNALHANVQSVLYQTECIREQQLLTCSTWKRVSENQLPLDVLVPHGSIGDA
jgi:hypothetical protein